MPHAVPTEPTRLLPVAALAPEPPPQRPRVRFQHGPAPALGDEAELAGLLRQRLRAISLVAAAADLILLLQLAAAALTEPRLDYLGRALGHPVNIMIHINFIAYLVLAWLAGRQPPRPVAVLRRYEALVFLLALAHTAAWNWLALHDTRPVAELLALGAILPHATVLSWLLAIVAYGTLIPNTGPRCAVMVGTMAGLALAFNAIGLVSQSAPLGATIATLVNMMVWLLYAVTIAIVGSTRLEKLRREASAVRQFGQYRLKERLGAGGMGEVYLAEHVLLRRPCAVKLIAPESAGDPQILRRFEREVQATAALSHPHTVQVYDYGLADDGTFYYAMEYLPGQTLEQLVQREGPLPAARALRFLKQLCGSLNEAHGAGLVHRDLKPANVMICTRGGIPEIAKLLDFGLVLPMSSGHVDERLSGGGDITGTPAYMSPEQAGGSLDLDARSDIYSLGALAYFLLSGRSPFAGRPLLQMIAAHLYEPPEPLRNWRPDLPLELERVVRRCLEKRPADRYPDVRALNAALMACRIEPLAAGPNTRSPRSPGVE